MTQPFDAKIIVTGFAAEVARFTAYLATEWAEMQKDDTIIKGFRWVQNEAPSKRVVSSKNGIETVELEFVGDGSTPEAYAIVLSSQFPDLRISLLVADSSCHEWLAGAIVAYKTSWVRSRFNFGEKGFFAVRKSNALMIALKSKADELHKRILDDGSFAHGIDSPIGKLYECGRLTETMISNIRS